MDTAIQITQQQLIYIALIGAGVGLIIGLIPLILAIKRRKLKLGLLAVALSTVAGGLGMMYYGGILLSLIISAIFLWLLLKKGGAVAAKEPNDPTVS